LGSGPLGLYAVAVARERGAGEIFVIGAPELRLDVARAWGASDVLDLERVPDFAARLQWVHDRTAGRGADILFQCANAPALLDAFEMVRRGGRLINIGVQAGAPLAVNPGVFFRGVRVSSVVMAQARHFYKAIVSAHAGRALRFLAHPVEQICARRRIGCVASHGRYA
jgi:threonine dehydrogenase-like Zn-dependent dehydrogenase